MTRRPYTPDELADRSGLAEAMADQWGGWAEQKQTVE